VGEVNDPSGGGLGGFLGELRRRHVVRAGITYAAVAFVILQAAEIIEGAWDFPEWGLRLVVVFTLLGFPLVLALAWVYEITRHGLRTTREVDGDEASPLEWGWLPRVALLAITFVVVGLSGWWWVRSTVSEDAARSADARWGSAVPASRLPGDPIRSLAVLPFETFSAERERGGDYFALGMHEALISQLSQLDFLRVASRTSAVQYDPTGKSAPQIGAELGVDALIEGSVLRAEGRVRITVQLIEAATDRHLWARDYERDLVDIIALQREVAEAIAQEVRGELSGAPADDLLTARVTASLVDPAAAEEVMRGRMVLAEGPAGVSPTGGALDSAAAHFQRASLLDPDFASAFSGLAQVYLLRGLAQGSAPDPADLLAAANSARRALELDPDSREIQEIFAHVALLGDPGSPPPVPVAPPAARVGAAPGATVATMAPAGTEQPMASVTEAGRQIQVAMALREADTDDPSAQLRAARRLSFTGLHDEARAILRAVLTADPQNLEAWDELEQVHRIQGDLGAVVGLWRDRLRRANESRGPGAPTLDELRQAVQRGIAGYWEWRLAELEGRQRRGVAVSPIELAAAYAGMGDQAQALTQLERGAEAGDPRLRSVRSDPVWDPYRRDGRFMAVLQGSEGSRGAPGRPGAPQASGRGGQGGGQGGGQNAGARPPG